MKLRIRDNSIRLRLTRGEVDEVNADGIVSANTKFPNGQTFSYSLRSNANCQSTAAQFDENQMIVDVPTAIIADWAETEQVSIQGSSVIDSADALKILVEKDFACLTPRVGEEESDMFEHPQAGGERC